ncbi:MAG TPA: phytanoyl-CoA dioxygenase family protein [Acidimicrobiales bacterium]
MTTTPIIDEARCLTDWNRDGFFIVRGLFDSGTAASLIDAAVAIARTRPELEPLPHVYIPEGRVRESATNPEEGLAKVFRLHRTAPFDAIARDDCVLDLVGAILGPDLDAFLSQFIWKWPEAYGQPWHQDSFYFPFEPDQQIGVWVAANRATITNGCLWVVPGSHTEPVHTHVADDRPNATQAYTKIVDHDMSAAVPVEMEPGDVLFFDSHLMHSSTDNESNELRAALVTHYALAGTEVLNELANTVTDWMPVRRQGAAV